MNFAKFSVGAAVVLCLSTALAAPTYGQSWEQGCVLLKTDGVITGQITQNGDQFVIKQNEGNTIRIDRSRIETVGSNIRELYLYKLARMPKFARGGDHGQLARWCLSVNLLAEAGEHYLIWSKSHPAATNPSVRQLGVEIKDRMLQQNDFRIAMGYAPIDRENANSGVSNDAKPGMKSNANVVTASANSNQSTSGELPVQIRAWFAEQTQHILINRCGQAACHGHNTKTPFRLFELGRDSAGQTQQNLDSVLKYVSQDPRAKSSLLEYLTKAHASMNAPAIGPREVHLINDVNNWVQLVQAPVVSAEGFLQPSSLNPLAPGAPQLRQVPKAPAVESSNSNAEFPEGALVPTAAELDALDALVRQQEPIDPQTIRSNVDPFDPNEFNRQSASKQ